MVLNNKIAWVNKYVSELRSMYKNGRKTQVFHNNENDIMGDEQPNNG